MSNQEPKKLILQVELTEVEAEALAQFVKRLSWSAMRECAVDDDEAYLIRAATDQVRVGLGLAGFAPR
jgi:hypothetical protein